MAGRVTRGQVEDLLGPPPYASVDGRSVAYLLTTRHGLQVVPLCLAVGSGRESQVAMRLEYGPDGVLRSYQTATASHELRLPIALISDGVNLSEEYEGEPALDMVQNGLDLHPTAAAPPPPHPRRYPPPPYVEPAIRPLAGGRPNDTIR